MRRRILSTYAHGTRQLVTFSDRPGWYVATTDARGAVRILWPHPFRSYLAASQALREHSP